LLIIIILSIIILDQITKYIALSYSYRLPLEIWQGAFAINLVRNSGGSFGLLKKYPLFFLLMTIAAICIISVYLYKRRERLPLIFRISLSMVLGGASGNLIDRIRYGYVVDFLDFKVWPVFNVADSCITIGITILACGMIFNKKMEGH